MFNRDIPTVRQALRAPVTVALLKGRANYVCHYHLERNLQDGRFASRADAAYLQVIARYAKTSKTGDRSLLAEVPEDAGVWPLVTSTRENCLGGDCPRYKDCFVMEARKQALAADVVVVNHHLFFADLVLRDEGVAELLPACNTVIFDEAHQLPETASLFFGESVSTSQLLELARDTRLEAAAAAKDFAALPEAAQALEQAARDLRLAAGEDGGRQTAAAGSMRAASSGSGWMRSTQKLAALGALLEFQAERSEGLENCWQRCCRPGWQAVALARQPMRRAQRQGSGALGRGVPARRAAQLHAAVDRRHFPAPDRGRRARLDLHLGDAVGEAGLQPLPAGDGAGGGAHGGLGQPVRLSPAGAAVRARAHAGAQQPGLHGGGGQGGAAGDGGEPRAARSCCSPACARCARRMHCSRTASRSAGHDFPLLLQGEDSRSSCWSASAGSATRCWWRASRSGRAWTCAARRCRW